MSTKATIIDTPDSHIYEETNRQQSIFGKFFGFDVLADIDSSSVKSIRFEGEYLEVAFKNNSPISKVLGEKIRLWGNDLMLVEMDEQYLSIEIKGGSQMAKVIIAKKNC